ncbi:MAG: hypothetical protein P1P90_01555 [Patescibacteria group bacterium]|nr:hypothetical protein [Patescibacteria group bacterium]
MIKAKVVSNKDGKVTLSLADGQSFIVSESEVVGEVKEGDTVNLLLASPGLETQASQELAKNLLNQLIKNF